MRRKTSIAAGRGGVPRPMSPSHQRGKIENSSGDPSLLCHQEARPRSSTPPTVPHQGLPTRPPPPLPQVTQVEAGLVAARMGPDEWAGAASGSWGRGRDCQGVRTQIKPTATSPDPAWPAMGSGGASPAGPGPAPGVGGRRGSGALGWPLDLSRSQSPPPRSLARLSPGPPTIGVPRRSHSVPGEPCQVDTFTALRARELKS